MDLNKFGKRAYTCALRRGKIHENLSPTDLHEESVAGICEEFNEFVGASEEQTSEHLDKYSAAVEELSDIIIASITELYRRGVDIETVLHAKMKFNENR